MREIIRIGLFLIAMTALIAGCGNKGDLYLPDEASTDESTDRATDESRDEDTVDAAGDASSQGAKEQHP